MRDRVRISLSILVLAILPGISHSAVTVIERTRLGNNVEDITVVRTGPLANHIVTMDGYDVFAIPAIGRRNASFRKLFNVKGLPVNVGPRGITHVDSERLFALVDPSQPGLLIMADENGNPAGTRAIQFFGGYVPNQTEGIETLPPDAERFAGHLALVALAPVDGAADPGHPCAASGIETRIQFLAPDGQAKGEIIPADPDVRCTYSTGVSYRDRGRMMLTALDGQIRTLDFDGNLVSTDDTTMPSGGEGMVQLRDGRIVASQYHTGRLLHFDRNLNRLPGDDLANPIGIGISRPVGISWDSEEHQYLLVANFGLEAMHVASVSQGYDATASVIDIQSNGNSNPDNVAFMAGEGRIAVAQRNPRRIQIYERDGSLVETLAFPPSPALPGGPLRSMFYDAASQRFRFRIGNFPPSLFVLRTYTRTGAPVSTLNVGVPVGSTTIFNTAHPSGGELLMASSLGRIFRMDLSGSVSGQFHMRNDLNLRFIGGMCAITSGPKAGAFAAVDTDASEVVVFTVD